MTSMDDTCSKCSGPLMCWEYDYASPCYYDGISELVCDKCDIRYGRWSGKILNEGEHEPPYGDKHRRGCVTTNNDVW